MYRIEKEIKRLSVLTVIMLMATITLMISPAYSKGIVSPSERDNRASDEVKTQNTKSNTTKQKSPAIVNQQNNSINRNNYSTRQESTRQESTNTFKQRQTPETNRSQSIENRNEIRNEIRNETRTNSPRPTQPIIRNENRNEVRSENRNNIYDRSNIERQSDQQYNRHPDTKMKNGWLTPGEIADRNSNKNKTSNDNSRLQDLNRINDLDRNNSRSKTNDLIIKERNADPPTIRSKGNESNIQRNDFRDNNSGLANRKLPTTRDVPPNFRLPKDPRSDYRKDFEDIGNMWKKRYERKGYHNNNHGDSTKVNIFLGSFAYQHYCYDYRPLYSYPSAYCYYYDYYPPYIYGNRILFYEPFNRRRDFNEITIFMNYTDNFYYTDPFRQSLNSVLRDIERSWLDRDIDRFMQYVRPRSSIAIFMRGNYNYSLDWLDYMDMTRDAMNSINTNDFRFDKVVRRQETGEIVAYAKHKFYDWDDSIDTIYVSYTFERVSGDWYITETGTSTYKNW